MKYKSIILFGLIVCLLTGCSVNEVQKPQIVNPNNLIVDSNAEPIPEKEEIVTPKTVAIPGWNSISIPADYAEVYVDFYNPEANADLYYLTFEWRLLNDSEQGYEVIYKSDLIAPGESTEKITLTKAFEVGEYDTTIFVQPYKMDGITPTNNANMNTKLIVR